MPSSDHDLLTLRAVRWLRNTKRCSVVFSEISTAASIRPDAIGWHAGTLCHLVECKVSVIDYRMDRKKPHIRFGETPGHFRWYFTPAGLLSRCEIREDWGLVEVHGKQVRVIKRAPQQVSCARTERIILTSGVRRLQGSEYGYDHQTGRFWRRD